MIVNVAVSGMRGRAIDVRLLTSSGECIESTNSGLVRFSGSYNAMNFCLTEDLDEEEDKAPKKRVPPGYKHPETGRKG